MSIDEVYGVVEKEGAGWRAINLAAMQLIDACARHGDSTRLTYTRAWITAGEKNSSRILLHKMRFKIIDTTACSAAILRL